MNHDADPAGPTCRSYDLWWQLLLARIAHSKKALAGVDRGTVCIEVARSGERPVYFGLHLEGTHTAGRVECILRPDAWVRTSERELDAMLFSNDAPAKALRVSGRANLFVDLLQALVPPPVKGTWLQAAGGML